MPGRHQALVEGGGGHAPEISSAVHRVAVPMERWPSSCADHDTSCTHASMQYTHALSSTGRLMLDLMPRFRLLVAGVLLYGPPGNGKTMLAKAVATECETTFFNISASSVVSKWRGDSEKLIRVLFELARHHAPSTVFLDELDSVMMSRDGGGEHEASRRMKTELLIQMDGLAKSESMVFVLGASNVPWDLDHAALRRFEKRILVAMPDAQARAQIFSLQMQQMPGGCEVSSEQLAAQTEGFSGSDVVLLAKEAAMRPLRRLMLRIEQNAVLPVDACCGSDIALQIHNGVLFMSMCGWRRLALTSP